MEPPPRTPTGGGEQEERDINWGSRRGGEGTDLEETGEMGRRWMLKKVEKWAGDGH